ncbi:hypothetical protein [Cupriavidus sp. D384]|uniref:hypothetical protein n=1 Tax=Cupriavidus sp. D384 TaxID=1538095 RepID=UPI000836BFAB|nr:hypothetical protein [Cupriavidus sp. D384]
MDHHQAADLIAADLQVGAVEPYCSGEQALEYLGAILAAGNTRRLPNESPAQQLSRAHELMGARAHAVFDDLIHGNAQRVSEEENAAARHARSDAKERLTERGAA